MVFEREETGRKIAELLEHSGAAHCLLCASGSQARRLLSDRQIHCVVCAPRLSDGPADWLADDLPPSCSLLMVGPRHLLELCSHPDIYKLPTPVRREDAVITVSLLIQFGRRMERALRGERTRRPQRSDEERALIERAKAVLMRRYRIGEEEAHRALQRRSMNAGCRLAEAARKILGEQA